MNKLNDNLFIISIQINIKSTMRNICWHICKYNYNAIFLKNNFQKRFITDSDILKYIKGSNTKRILRTSTNNSKISKVIKLIKNNKYDEVKQLIIKENIDINSHDNGENTPLTDAAYRGDIDAIKFLFSIKNINPHASCDCPFHKTALHYATERGHYVIVQLLLEKGADPNVLDSRKYSALDLAKNDGIKKLLISHGGVNGEHIKVSHKLNLPKAGCLHQLK